MREGGEMRSEREKGMVMYISESCSRDDGGTGFYLFFIF